MDRSTFRRDPYLRSSAYHLATWSLAAFVFELRLGRGQFDAASVGLYGVLLGGAILTSITHERRVGKMAGPAGDAVWSGAGAMWLRLLGTLVTLTGMLAFAGRGDLLFAAWAFGVGWGFAVWGWKANFPWYAGLGLGLAWVALVDAAMLAAGTPMPMLRGLVLAVGLPALALRTNHRFLWFRPG